MLCYVVAGFRNLIRESSIFIKNKTKVACRIEWRVVLESCCLRPITRNSVLKELRVRRFADIQEEMCFRAVWTLEVGDTGTWVKVARMEREKSSVSSAYRWWLRESGEIRVLSGVVYMTKNRGPRTEPRRTPQEECSKDKFLRWGLHTHSRRSCAYLSVS